MEQRIMEFISSNIHYWLVEHPSVSTFEWREGETWGSSPNFMVTIVVTYLSLTFILYNTFLSSRPVAKNPSSLSSILLRRASTLHNLFMVILSLIMVVGSTLSAISEMPNTSWIFCFPADKASPTGPVFFWVYIFYLSKIAEFGDTLLILLSRDARRLSFLHVYHRSVVMGMAYLWLQTAQSLASVGVLTNPGVHIIMYTYYMLCSLGIKPAWKRLVTDCQIIQFWFSFSVSAVTLWLHFTGKTGCSGIGSVVFTVVFNASLLSMFCSFRANRNNYTTKSSAKMQ